MRPKDLTFPFTWEKRRPVIHEGVLIVPKHYDCHGDFSLKSHLASDTPLCVEYCSGNGDWVVKRASLQPDRLWIAVEMQFQRVRKIWSKMRNTGIENLLIVCGEALTFTQQYLWRDGVDEAFVNFPDPWRKRRHSKHRLMRPPFVAALSHVVKSGGRVVYATDQRDYALEMIELMQGSPRWESVFPKPYFLHSWNDYGRSWFGDLFARKGERVHFIQYRAL